MITQALQEKNTRQQNLTVDSCYFTDEHINIYQQDILKLQGVLDDTVDLIVTCLLYTSPSPRD